LFGGLGYDGSGIYGNLNDLWKYNPSSGEWTWMGGSSSGGQQGSYGTKGSAAASNVPGARDGAASWVGPDGNLWLFGGLGNDGSGIYGHLNDLWRLDSDPGMLSLDGSSSYGKIDDANALNVSSAMTLEAWVKFNDVSRSGPNQNYMVLAMKGDYKGSYGLMLNTGSSNKTLSFYHNGLSTANTDYNWTGIQTGTWYHVAATYDGSTSKIYIDGVLKTTASVTGSINTTTDSLFIGQEGGSTPYRLNGTIGEVRLWNNSLSQQDIQDNMNLSISGQ